MLLPIILVTFLAATAYGLMVGEGLPGAPSIEALTVGAASISPVSNALRRRRGRPRKFQSPSRAVTLTLPETTLEKLSAIDSDLSRAVVAMTSKKASLNGRPPAELSVFGRRAVITIRPTRSLAQHTGIDLVPLPDGRALIMFEHPQTTAELELLILDALDHAGLDAEDRRVFEGIGTILRDARRSNDVALTNRTIIVLESTRPLAKNRNRSKAIAAKSAARKRTRHA